MVSAEQHISESNLERPAYQFVIPGTLLFMNGAPLSGKSTLAPHVVANIAGCGLQSTDIIRLVAQEMDERLPVDERDPLLQLGSCDSYLAIGDGRYSPTALIEGYNRHSEAVNWLLHRIIPKLEAQGAREVLFEGVHLLPSIVNGYLVNNNKLITICSDGDTLEQHRDQLFGPEPSDLTARYAIDRLLLVQKELLQQAGNLPESRTYRVDNRGSCTRAVEHIMEFLCSSGTIEPLARND